MFTPAHQPRRTDVRYCRYCGAAVERRAPGEGDSHERAVCPACGTIHYVNPLPVVGTVPVLDDGRVLLCRRAIEPRLGYWTLPSGFMELDETLAQGALRETLEEAGAQIEMGPLFTLISVARVAQVHVYFRARLLSAQCDPGPETLAVRLAAETEVPWDEIAFPSVRETLRRYFADRRAGTFGVHEFDLP
ncbi:MAG: NUDIX hydrolase [Burkholderiaceae bacterium]|jgi:ADP-ribose pyrophosphatase YjhB (NUDIX family)|nr:NUDIX hydrolase [Burkholderiaceae bacterium]